MALFRDVANLAEMLAGESSRLKKRAAIAEAIRAVHEAEPESEDAGRFALYVAGTPFAEADQRKLNAGGALLTKALLNVSGAPQVALTAAYRKHGDLGAAGFDLMAASEVHAKRPSDPALTLFEIADAFDAMAAARTTAVRAALVEGLLERATPLEAKYLLKLMIGDMRIGVKQSLVEEAIAVAADAPVAEVRNAVMLEADLAFAAQRAFAGTLKEARMRLFHPLGFMLASPVDSPEEAVERFEEKPASEAPVRSHAGRQGELDQRRSEELDACAEAASRDGHRGLPRGQVRRHARTGALRRSGAAGARRHLLAQSRGHDGELSRNSKRRSPRGRSRHGR